MFTASVNFLRVIKNILPKNMLQVRHLGKVYFPYLSKNISLKILRFEGNGESLIHQ